jgi:hypothetical protein
MFRAPTFLDPTKKLVNRPPFTIAEIILLKTFSNPEFTSSMKTNKKQDFFFFFISKYQFIKSARDATYVHRKYTKRAHKYKLLIRKRHKNLEILQVMMLAKNAPKLSMRKEFEALFSSNPLVQSHGPQNSVHSFPSINTTLHTRGPFSKFVELFDYPFVLSNSPSIPSNNPASPTQHHIADTPYSKPLQPLHNAITTKQSTHHSSCIYSTTPSL